MTVPPVEMDVWFHAVDGGADVAGRMPEVFAHAWPAYRSWFLRDGEESRASYVESRRAVERHLPELVPLYDRLVTSVGGGDLEARFLSHWSPPPLFAACSMAGWARDRRVLVRNYDFPPALCDTTVVRSAWDGVQVIAMSDCVLGALDGMNSHGLAVAISFGGRKVVGPGFGIGIVVRYLLQTCRDVPSALAALDRVPVAMAYNVALLDSVGRSVVAFVAPDRPMQLAPGCTAANRQGVTEWPEHAQFCGTEERERVLADLVSHPHTTADSLVDAFLAPPIYRPMASTLWGTVYTAVYDIDAQSLTLRWPDDSWELGIPGFVEGHRSRRSLVAPPPALHLPMPQPAQERPLLIA